MQGPHSGPPREVRQSPNVSTTLLRQWGFRQCLPFSWTTIRGKHCRHPIAVMGVVDTFRHGGHGTNRDILLS
jgi:hypothetical protein